MPTLAIMRTCAECDRQRFPEDERRWRADHGGDDLDEPAKLVFYSLDCAETGVRRTTRFSVSGEPDSSRDHRQRSGVV